MKNHLRLGAILTVLLAFVVVLGVAVWAFTGSSEVVVNEGASPVTAPGAVSGISPVGVSLQPAGQAQPGAGQHGDNGADGATTSFLDWTSQARAGQAPSQPPMPPAPLPGSIRGVVTGAGSVPLQGIDVLLADGNGTLTGRNTVSGPAGNFSFGSLAPGSYRIFFSDVSGNYQSGWYGDPSAVNVAAGAESYVAWSLTRVSSLMGSITGTVSDGGGKPLAGVEVLAYAVDQPLITLELRGTATTSADGSYSISGLSPLSSPPGSLDAGYKVLFIPPAGELSYQWYRGQSLYEDAELLPVMAGETVGKVDAQFQRGGSISGRVTGDGKAPLAGAVVEVFDSTAIIVAQVRTGPDGSYQTASLPAGSYRVRAGAEGYESRWYDGKNTLQGADEVDVTAGMDTGAIDFSLDSQPKAYSSFVNTLVSGQKDGSGGNNAISRDASRDAASLNTSTGQQAEKEPGSLEEPGAEIGPRAGNEPGTGDKSGAGNSPGMGTEPGAGNSPGEENTPGAGDEARAGNIQSAGDEARGGNTQSTEDEQGSGNTKGAQDESGTGNSPGAGTP